MESQKGCVHYFIDITQPKSEERASYYHIPGADQIVTTIALEQAGFTVLSVEEELNNSYERI